MKLVLEGPDNAGKTTLANYILAESWVKVRYHHPGGAPSTLEEEVKCIEDQYERLQYDYTIVDRVTCISQMVYNPDVDLDSVRRMALGKLLGVQKLFFVYCRPCDDRLMRVQDLTWRDGETEDHKQKIIQNQHKFIRRYDDVMRTVPHIAYDFEGSDAATVRSLLVNGMRGGHSAATFLNDMIALKGSV